MQLSTDTRNRTNQLLREIAGRADLFVPFDVTQDTDTQTLKYVEAIAYRLSLLPPIPTDPSMTTVTKTIGTTGRDYSTMTAWEADLDNGAIYSSGDDAIGECYADSDFDETFTINGGGTVGLASRTLTAAVGERHDGTASGGGVVNNYSGTSIFGGNLITLNISNTVVSWLRVTGTSFPFGVSSSGGDNENVSNCVLHGIQGGNILGNACIKISNGLRGGKFQNNIIYNASIGNSNTIFGIRIEGAGSTYLRQSLNNTIYNCGVGYSANDDATVTIRNTFSGGNASADFSPSSFSNATVSNIASEDTTASGSGSLTSLTVSDQFVSTAGGSEDFHLKSGADLIDAGLDLATTPANVNIDIDGRDRDAEADTWDIGADEFVAGGGSSVSVAQASEQDLALTIGIEKTLALAIASEQDLALAPTIEKTLTAALASEQDTAQAITAAAGSPIGQATEQDLAPSATWSKAVDCGLTTEQDTALPATPERWQPLAMASEQDLAQTVTISIAAGIGPASEQDQALLATWKKTVGLALASEQDLALTITVSMPSLASPVISRSLPARRTEAAIPGRRTDTTMEAR